MKGVIMAGGKGTRLRPLTCNLPKPMVPLLDKPVMEYSIELLKQHGIVDIAVTLQYLPESIRNYFEDGRKFGVNLHYFEEKEPLGTAGSIKNAESFLDETFVVISGDGLTDFNLSQGIEYHHQKNSFCTIFTKQVENPVEFGLVVANQTGEITKFIEKPKWNEVCSDTVNTGIYIMEPDILTYIEKNEAADFSKNIFPELLKSKHGLYAYSAEGYWTDIGNFSQYRQAHNDLLSGAVQNDLMKQLNEVSPGIFLGKQVTVEAGAYLNGPMYIGSYTTVRAGAKIEEFSVIGQHTIIDSKASIKRSIIWNDGFVGQSCELRGVILANYNTIHYGASLFECSVIGSHCLIDEKAIIKPNVKLWPNKQVEAYAIVHSSLMWGEKLKHYLFSENGIEGLANIEMTPEFMLKIGASFGTLFTPGQSISVASEDHICCEMLKASFIQGVRSTGVSIIEVNARFPQVMRATIVYNSISSGIFIGLHKESRIMVEFYNGQGVPLQANTMQKVELIFQNGNFRRAAFDKLGALTHLQENAYVSYKEHLLTEINPDPITRSNIKVVVSGMPDNDLTSLLKDLFAQLNILCIFTKQPVKSLDVSKLVLSYQASIGVQFLEKAQKIMLVDENGTRYSFQKLSTLLTSLILTNRSSKSCLEAGRQPFNQYTSKDIVSNNPELFQVLNDGVMAFVKILEFLTHNNIFLSTCFKEVPEFSLLKDDVPCSIKQKSFVMRKLLEECDDKRVDLNDGITLKHDDGGWTKILPDQMRPILQIVSQNIDPEKAKSISNYYIKKIKQFQKERFYKL